MSIKASCYRSPQDAELVPRAQGQAGVTSTTTTKPDSRTISTPRKIELRNRARAILKDLCQDIADNQLRCAMVLSQDLLVCLSQWFETSGYDKF
jgi:hypothetical protein